MTLQWVAVEQLTGRLIADLPDLSAGALKMTIGRYESVSASLPIPTAPDDWQRATRPGHSALVCLDGDLPLWGGLVVKRGRAAAAGGSYTAQLGLVTAEGYLDRRYVGDEDYSASQTAIAADLVDSYAGAAAAGLPWAMDVTASPTIRQRTYRDDEDATVYSRLTQLMGVLGGPEWTVGWQWLHSPERLVPVFRCRDRLGTAPLPGLQPNASFEMPGGLAEITTAEDYSSGSGANSVTATGSSQGDARPQSPAQLGPDDGRPRYEFRWSPSSSTTDVGVLTEHAQRALGTMQEGSNAITLVANRAEAPRLGIDWDLGDDIAYTAEHGDWPDGLSGIGRAIGWQLDVDADTVAPILVAASIEEGGGE